MLVCTHCTVQHIRVKGTGDTETTAAPGMPVAAAVVISVGVRAV